MGVSFIVLTGERFRDQNGIEVTFVDYDEMTHCMFFAVEGIMFSMSFDDFVFQYCMGIIMEVHDGQAAKDLV